MIAHGWRALLLLTLLGLAPGGLAANVGNAWTAHEQAGVALMLLGLTLAAALLGMARKARHRAQVAGDAALLGSLATVTVVQADNPYQGSVQAQGEEWQAQCATPLQAGQHVRVTARHGLVLDVSASAPTLPGE